MFRYGKIKNMEKEIIRDRAGNPVSVLMDYRQWLQIEQLLEHQKIKVNAPDNPLDWYTLTETANSILNDLIAYTGRERFLELEKEFPDQNRMDRLWSLFKEIQAINRNTDNFKDATIMKEIILTYGTKLKSVNNGQQLV